MLQFLYPFHQFVPPHLFFILNQIKYNYRIINKIFQPIRKQLILFLMFILKKRLIFSWRLRITSIEIFIRSNKMLAMGCRLNRITLTSLNLTTICLVLIRKHKIKLFVIRKYKIFYQSSAMIIQQHSMIIQQMAIQQQSMVIQQQSIIIQQQSIVIQQQLKFKRTWRIFRFIQFNSMFKYNKTHNRFVCHLFKIIPLCLRGAKFII